MHKIVPTCMKKEKKYLREGCVYGRMNNNKTGKVKRGKRGSRSKQKREWERETWMWNLKWRGSSAKKTVISSRFPLRRCKREIVAEEGKEANVILPIAIYTLPIDTLI